MTDKEQIQRSMTKILDKVGYVHTSSYDITGQQEPARKLGSLMFDYFVSAGLDCNWEGFNEGYLKGISELLQDMVRYLDLNKPI